MLGAAGHHGAIQAAKLGKKVVVVERSVALGGSSVNTGTIPSKTLRETVLRSTRSGCTDRRISASNLAQRIKAPDVHNGYLDIFPLSFSGSTAACSGRGDFFKVAATLCATLWVARRLPPMNRTLPSTTCSWTTWPSRVTN